MSIGTSVRDNADVKHFRALLAAEIIKTLDRERLSARQAMRAPASPRRTSPASATPI